MAETTRPVDQTAQTPSFIILDGANGSGGNPDFFFLPPMVGNPDGDADWDATGFNDKLMPTVKICTLDATSAADVNNGAPCKSGGYLETTTLSGPTDEQYHHNWQVPSSSDVFYKIEVLVGSKSLGFADVETAANPSQLKNVNTGEFVALKDGRTLPVKFRVEQYALCETPGTGPCTSETISLATGGTVTSEIPGLTEGSGVTIPPQPNGITTTITVTPCFEAPALNSLNPIVTDLPTFGPCIDITTDPVLTAPLVNAATVFVCDIGPYVPSAMPLDQRERITLHRYDPGVLTALPHADGCPYNVADAGGIRGFFADLTQGAFLSAGKRLVSLVAPKPLYAATRRIDQGAGGLTLGFSFFQFMLPSTLEIVEGDGQVGIDGSTLPIVPKVALLDLAGDPVVNSNALVRWSSSVAACAALPAGAGGQTVNEFATDVPWTIALGTNTRAACGRGLAGTDFNGPRAGVDPFQPLDTHFGDPSDGPAVLVETGSVEFTATGNPAGPVSVTIENPDFEILYKSGSTTITANPFSPLAFAVGTSNVGMTTSGTLTFSDASTGSVVDLPGWMFSGRMGVTYLGESSIGAGHGNVAFFNGNFFGGLTGAHLLSQVLGENLAQGTTYTLTAEFGWRTDNAGATGPVVLDLYAGGTLLVPTSSTSPALVQGDVVTYSRTYTVNNIAISGPLKVEVGLGPNTDGRQLNADDVTLSKTYVVP